jgi:hypothetical protein
MMSNKDNNTEFAQIALALNTENSQAAFTRMVTSYVSKIAAMKLVSTAEATEHAMDMGQWMLVELAQSLWGLPLADAMTVVRRSIRAARAALQDKM